MMTSDYLPKRYASPEPDIVLDTDVEPNITRSINRDADDDTIPLTLPSAHAWKPISSQYLQPDPDLCITPDKGRSNRSNLLNGKQRKHEVTSKPRVHFTCDVSSEEMSEGAESDEGIVTKRPDFDSNEKEEKESFMPKTIRYDIGNDINSKYFGNNVDIVECFGKSSNTFQGNDNKSQNTRKSTFETARGRVLVSREIKEDTIVREYQFPFSDSESECEPGHALARPEYNSTLRMSEELKDLRAADIDISKALKTQLQTSDTKSTEINEKAAAKVNRPNKEVFTGLVSLDVPVEDVRSRVELTKTLMTKISVEKSSKAKTAMSQDPDVMEFFSADLQREPLDFSLPGISVPIETLSTAPASAAFDLYRHNRVWQCID